MVFTLKEKLVVTVLLFLTYLLPAIPEWLGYQSGHFQVISISAPIWLVCFYIGPFWLHYGLNSINVYKRLPVIAKGIIFILLMCVGANLVNRLHQLAFENYHFPISEQITSAILWGVFYFSMAEFYAMFLHLQREKKLREQVQWVNLNNRLNPHFLFNCLNTISALMYQSVDEADAVLHKLSDILRYSLEKQEQWVSLTHELDICRTYLAIEKARFTDNLHIDWQCDEFSLNNVNVPPLLLQPLIENSIKHVKSRPIKITIVIERAKNHLVCLVTDNGQGFDSSTLRAFAHEPVTSENSSLGQGLAITAQRALLLGGSLNLLNNGGAQCKLMLPLKACESF